jgi:hypothetical protein
LQLDLSLSGIPQFFFLLLAPKPIPSYLEYLPDQ